MTPTPPTNPAGEAGTPAIMPVQLPINHNGASGQIRSEVVMRAYEVYCHLYGPQVAMVTGHCRGGFGSGELIAFLYARSFPKEEWSKRTDEALKGMKI